MINAVETKMHPITLRFAGEIEEEFLEEYSEKLQKSSRYGLLIGIFLFTGFGFLDSFIMPEVKDKVWIIRYAIVSPLISIGFLCTFIPALKRYIPLVVSMVVVLSSIGILAMIAFANSLGGYLYYAGILLCIMFAPIFSMRFIYSVTISSIVGISYIAVALLILKTPTAYLLNNIFFLIGANILSTIGSYSLELSNRNGFIKSRIIFKRTQELEEKNQELIDMNIELSQSREELLRSIKRAEMIFSALSEALPGTVLDDKYSLEEKIGSGGFGTVYRAKHLMLNNPVAVKIFKPSFDNNPLKNLERFRIEGISACKIHHPNAVSVLDFGVSANSIAYMVMELLLGHSLSEELNKHGNPSVARCMDIIIPVCLALNEAHASDIVHRDIKPSNIFIHQSKEGEVVKVVDFGIAKLMSDTLNPGSESLTETGTFLGTPAYMSPERLSNKPYDGKADVYSVGVMMYEMLCGMQPFQSSKDNYWSIVLMHMTHTPPSPRGINPYIPEKLEAVMMATLEKESQKRPTAKELSQMLEEFVSIEEPTGSAQTKDLSTKGFDTQRTVANQNIDTVGDINSSSQPTVKDKL